MADTYTTNLNLTKPEPGAAEDTWGISLNADLDSLDAIFSSSGTQINLNPNQINFADGKKAVFGNSSDLQIFHDGSNSYIKDTGTGTLRIQGSSSILMQKLDGEIMMIAREDGAVELNHNGSQKIKTTSSGISVTGTVKASTSLMVGSTDAPARDLEIKTTNPHIRLTDTDASGGYTEIFGGSGITTINADKGQAVAGSALKLSVDATDGLTIDSNHNVDIPNGNLDVTGTVTSDGLTVDGTTNLSGATLNGDLLVQKAAATITVKDNNDGGTVAYVFSNNSGNTSSIRGASSSQDIQIKPNEVLSALFESGGDISFYDDTGTSQNLKWDASADTLNFVDNAKATFGAGNDLQIYHNGSNSYIKDGGTGELLVQSNLVAIQNAAGSENMAKFIQDGAVQLYYDDSKKLATTSSGIDVTGTVTSDGLTSSGNLDIVSSYPRINLTDTGENPDYSIINANGVFNIYDVQNNSNRLSISSTGNATFAGTVTSDGFQTDTANTTYNLLARNSSNAAVYLQNGGTGDVLQVRSGNMAAGQGDLHLKVANNGDISFYDDTGTTQGLFWDASAERLGIGTTSPSEIIHTSTSSNNVGRFESTDATAYIQINDTADSFYLATGSQIGSIGGNAGVNANNLNIDLTNGKVGIGTSSPSTILEIASGNSGGDAALDSPTFRINNTTESADWDVGDVVGAIEYYTSDASGNAPYVASFIKSVNETGNGTLPSGALTFGTTTYNASGGAVERMRIDSSGNVLVGTTTAPNGTSVYGAGFINTGANGLVQWLSGASTTASLSVARFYNPNGNVGSIQLSGSSTSYATSSDARLKDVTGEARGLEVITKLNPVAYNWKADGKADEGLIAQEVKELVPNAVTGSEDEHYQMDYSKLVTHLVKAVQELEQQTIELKKEIANLKGE